MVQRYGTSSMPCDSGIYVLHSDYEALERERDALLAALADCREAAFDEKVDNPYLGGAVSDPLEVPAFVAYAFEWVCGMRDQWKANHDNQVSRARFLIERGDIPVERVRAYDQMAALQAFHAFFRDRCEGLFAQFGMAALDAYNEAARATRAKEKA